MDLYPLDYSYVVASNCFIIPLCSQLRPPMMIKLLRKMALDVPTLNENTVVPLRV